jgi:CHAD domain-containing protein
MEQEVISNANKYKEPFVRYGQKQLTARVNTFLERRVPVLKNEDVEDVHKMRVASRRLRATLDAYQAITKPKPFKKAYQRVKEAADVLGVARDADVMKLHLEEQFSQAPADEQAGVQWFLNRLSLYREQQQQELEPFFRDFDEQALKKGVTECIPKKRSLLAKTASIAGLDPEGPAGQNARLIAQTKLEELSRWDEYADIPYAVKELHRLRIAAKRLRYTLEIFADVLPATCTSVVKEVTQLQDELGVLHDSDVFIALLRLCLSCQENPTYARLLSRVKNTKGGWLRATLVATLLDPATVPTASERYGLERLLQMQEQTRETRYHAFRTHWSCLQEQDFRRHLLDLLSKETEEPIDEGDLRDNTAIS